MEPEDCQWGLEASGGNWTGIVGTLQHEKADFSMDLTLTSERATAVNFCRVYIDENMVILSSKPRPPPEYLSLIKPFEGIVWLIVVVSVMVWGVMLWCLLRIRNRVSQGSSMDIASSLFYGWGLLLEDRPYEPPANLTGQVLVGIWLISCLILRAFYMSSLISRLVEGGKPPVINVIEEMVARGETDGWQWGTVTMTGVFNTFFSTSSNPDFLIAKEFMQQNTSRLTHPDCAQEAAAHNPGHPAGYKSPRNNE
ncbi:putative glutamate receptor [Portunus trituberculatus]|uniref:Putative glutamate receptor n=1 Tax=Portunus trituberculatus TaxID=210409 RepID=A0A5B7GPZ4_PORTR|nr:putative glutamate receptor [Portunus trituberculatus]